MNPDGTIPTDNPYYSDSRYDPAVYAIGFRNPYRIHIDPVTGWVLYGDNNPDARVVDPNRGPAGISEWGVVTEPGQNHGWPLCVGANEPYMDYDYWTGTNHGPFDCSTFTPAYVWQEYTLMWRFPQLGQGGSSPISGVILRRPAPDAKYQWSEEYLNHWYPADFTRGFIARSSCSIKVLACLSRRTGTTTTCRLRTTTIRYRRPTASRSLAPVLPRSDRLAPEP